MKFVEQSYEFITPLDRNAILKRIEECGRVCYKSEDKITEDSSVDFVKKLVSRGHEAMIEHVNLTIKFITDRGVSHEIVRHRVASYAQESTRYVSYGERGIEILNEEDVIYAYTIIGLSMKKISQNSKSLFTEWEIYNILNDNDIKRRNLGSRGIVNEDYFKQINSAECAYLIGFIVADGNIKKDLSQLTISQKEDEQWFLLNMFRDFIQPEAQSLHISNKIICQDLFNIGIIPNKTYDFSLENIQNIWHSIPLEFKHDFLRGLLDGDGSIRWFYQNERSQTMSCQIQWTGNQYLMQIISDFIFENYNYNTTVRKDFNSEYLYRICVTDSKIGKILCENLYNNFIFPYGHSKSSRYFEAFDLKIPYKKDNIVVKDFNVIIPECDMIGNWLWKFGNVLLSSEIAYKNMIANGVKPEIARSILPNCLKTEVVMTANLREWRHFLKLRTAPTAHPQMRALTLPLLAEFKEVLPEVFGDIKGE